MIIERTVVIVHHVFCFPKCKFYLYERNVTDVSVFDKHDLHHAIDVLSWTSLDNITRFLHINMCVSNVVKLPFFFCYTSIIGKFTKKKTYKEYVVCKKLKVVVSITTIR